MLEHIADGARTESGSELVSAECTECGRVFEYERHWAMLRGERRHYSRATCDDCVGREEERYAERARREAYEEWAAHYSGGDLGTRLARASFAGFEAGPHNAKALELATGWVEAEQRPNLLIVGPIGCGKSYLAACVHNALHARYEVAYWLNAGSLMALIRRGFVSREAADDAGSRIERAGRAPILVLDDLGKVHPGKDVSWVEETFYAIIDARYRNELPTVVTTEWKSAALAERVGESVVSRLQDGAWVAGIKKPASAYRRPAA